MNRVIHSCRRCQASGRCSVPVPVAVPGGAGGDVDEVTADGGAAGLAGGEAGRDPAARSRLCVMAAQASQPALAGKNRGQVRQRPVVPVGEDLLDDRVVAVLTFGLGQLERGVGGHRVVAPGGEQLVLPGLSLAVKVADPAHDQPGGDRLAFLRGERGVFHLGDLGVRDPAAELVIPDRTRVADCRPGRRRDGRGDLGVRVHRDREPGAGPAGGTAERGGVNDSSVTHIRSVSVDCSGGCSDPIAVSLRGVTVLAPGEGFGVDRGVDRRRGIASVMCALIATNSWHRCRPGAYCG